MTRTFLRRVDHTLNEPRNNGRVDRPISSATKTQRDRADSRSFVATWAKRNALRNTSIIFVHDSWCHVVGGVTVAKFDSCAAAVEAL